MLLAAIEAGPDPETVRLLLVLPLKLQPPPVFI